MPYIPSQGVQTGRVQQTLVIPDDDECASLELFTFGMPYVFIWCTQTVPAAASPITTQTYFAESPSLAGQKALDWLALGAPALLIPGQPVTFRHVVPAVKIRLSFTRTAGVASTVKYIIACAPVG